LATFNGQVALNCWFWLSFWRGHCEPWIPPWVFFLVRSAESWNCLSPWICLEYPSFFALESWTAGLAAAWSLLPWIALPLLSAELLVYLLVQRKRVIYLISPGCDPVMGDNRAKQFGWLLVDKCYVLDDTYFMKKNCHLFQIGCWYARICVYACINAYKSLRRQTHIHAYKNDIKFIHVYFYMHICQFLEAPNATRAGDGRVGDMCGGRILRVLGNFQSV